MANIFNEVDEDIRKERYQNLWSKYGKYVIGFLILIVIIFSLSQYLHFTSCNVFSIESRSCLSEDPVGQQYRCFRKL